MPLVEPRRFFLETAEGLKISPRMSGRKEPTLGVKYLENGTSLSGWLTFQVPEKAKKLILKADFEQPPLSLPVPSPKNAQDP